MLRISVVKLSKQEIYITGYISAAGTFLHLKLAMLLSLVNCGCHFEVLTLTCSVYAKEYYGGGLLVHGISRLMENPLIFNVLLGKMMLNTYQKTQQFPILYKANF